MPNSATFAYNAKSRRYKDVASGRYISAQQVRSAVDTIIDAESEKIRGIAQSLVDGQINLAEFQIQTSALLKNLHVSMGIAACGGVNAVSEKDLGYIGSLIKEQYKYLRSMSKQIKNGQQPLDGTLVARSALYTQAARAIFEDVQSRVAESAGCTEEKSILAPADHCSQCVSEAAKGWVAIGTLIPIGSRLCRTNCRCRMLQR